MSLSKIIATIGAILLAIGIVGTIAISNPATGFGCGIDTCYFLAQSCSSGNQNACQTLTALQFQQQIKITLEQFFVYSAILGVVILFISLFVFLYEKGSGQR